MGKLTAKNINILKSSVIATGEPFLDVTADIYEGKEKLETKKYGFSFDTPTKEIIAEITKSLSTFRIEREQREANKERDDLEKQADESISAISGLEIEEPVN